MSSPNEETSAAEGAAAALPNETLTADEMEERRHYEKVNESITQLMGIMIDPNIVLQKIEELDEMYKKKADYEEACIKEYLSEINKKYEDITAIANNLRSSMDEMKEKNREYAQNVLDLQRMCDTQNSVNTELEKMKEEVMDVDMEAELQNTAQDEFVETQEGKDEPSKQEAE